jgi:glycosyltransferase involved in cell wall biosynthesis
MVQQTTLPEEALKRINEIGEADILVGIPSFNNGKTIGHVVKAVNAGLAKYFPKAKSVLINSDGGSSDGTPELVAEATVSDYKTILINHPLYTVHKITTPYHGLPGKGSAFRTIFRIAELLKVKACAVVDSDLRSITPEWIDLLLSPVYNEGFEFVAPLYLRHKYDGTITNSVVYPLTRSLYGKRIRQPIGGEFGFSGNLASRYLTYDVWHTDVARFGIDIWMTTIAIAGGFNVCQSFLGAKIHDVKDPGADLAGMMIQVVGSLFSLMESNVSVWKEVKNSESTPVFGFQFGVGTEPINVNVERMINIFKLGLHDLKEIWAQILQPENLKELERLEKKKKKGFRIPKELWVKLIFDFALAYHKKIIAHEHLIKSLIPLYMGRTASFVMEAEKSSAEEVEGILEELCFEFEREKDYLIERWDEKGGDEL